MSRRKVIFASIVGAIAVGVLGFFLARGPTMRAKFHQLRPGMSYEEVFEILGNWSTMWPENGTGKPFWVRWNRRGRMIDAWFGADDRLENAGYKEETPPAASDRFLNWLGL